MFIFITSSPAFLPSEDNVAHNHYQYQIIQ